MQKSTGVVSLSRSAREAVLKRDGVGCVAGELALWGKPLRKLWIQSQGANGRRKPNRRGSVGIGGEKR